MLPNRRQFLTTLAAGSATVLSACGGGGDEAPPTRPVWLLNLDPEFPSADVSIGSTFIASALPFQGLTSRADVEYGTYTFGLRERSTGFTQTFDGVSINASSPSMFVFYRHFDTSRPSRLGSTPPGIINYFDSTVSLDVDLYDDSGVPQLETLAFEGGASQTSNSAVCTLRLFAAGSSTKIYDSGRQARTDSILVCPRFPASSPRSGEVAVVGLNYNSSGASAVVWDNLLG